MNVSQYIKNLKKETLKLKRAVAFSEAFTWYEAGENDLTISDVFFC